jgi:hypothetical protein
MRSSFVIESWAGEREFLATTTTGTDAATCAIFRVASTGPAITTPSVRSWSRVSIASASPAAVLPPELKSA